MTALDRRHHRHEATREEIVEAAWHLASERGIAGISLRDLAARVGMRAPSLYTYFGSKDDLYDAMFAQANRDLLTHFEDWHEQLAGADPLTRLCEGAIEWIRWCQRSVPRYQLLYTRAIPGWEPSSDSYTIAGEVLARTAEVAAAAGLETQEDLDLYTAITGGLAAQQMANDPTGDRWTRLADRAVRLLVTDRKKGRK